MQGAVAGAPPPSYGAGYGPAYATAYGYGAIKAATQRRRVHQNLQPMGITWCLYGVMRLLKGLLAGAAVEVFAHHRGWMGDGPNPMPGFLSTLLPFIALTTVVMAGLSIATGYGLLTRQSWARSLAIVTAILSLIKIPLGTALGIYTLWVLAPEVSGQEYEAMSESAGGAARQAAR